MTFEQLKELICENFGVSEDKVTETADLQEELKLDSLDAVELSMMMEEAHGVSIPEEKFPECKTIADVLKFANGGN